MCDIVPGHLIVSIPPEAPHWPGGMSIEPRLRDAVGMMPGVSYIESMEQKLQRLDLKQHERTGYSLHLIVAKPGEENRTAALLYEWYDSIVKPPRTSPIRGDLTHSFVVAPNYVMTISGSSPTGPSISGRNFSFGPDYSQYQSMTRLPAGRPATARRVLVVDTGIAGDAKITIHSKRNILDVNNPSVDDDNGHGTAVALVIDDLAPGNEFIIYKAGDASGAVNEWDLLAALVADSGADVINLSVQYGLGTRVCSQCGRQSSSSRSAVFENIMNATAKWTNQPVIVAAAGNDQATELAYPARFGSIVAVGSVNSSKRLARESNTGDADHQGNLHHSHFVAPGGDSDPAGLEHVIELSNSNRYRGTSFAAAFVSAAVLAEMANQGTFTYSSVLSNLRGNADRSFTWHTNPEYGQGVVCV